MTEADIFVSKGKPWFSVGILISVAILAGSGVAAFLTQKSGQEIVLGKLAEREVRDKAADLRLDSIDSNMRLMQSDVNEALRDPWTGTDTRFWGLEQSKFWADFSKLNPTIATPTWPDPKRVRPDDARH